MSGQKDRVRTLLRLEPSAARITTLEVRGNLGSAFAERMPIERKLRWVRHSGLPPSIASSRAMASAA